MMDVAVAGGATMEHECAVPLSKSREKRGDIYCPLI